jgi:threonine synthase
VADGLLDDETYDWATVIDAVMSTGGTFPVLDDSCLLSGRERAVAAGYRATATGAAGLAALGRVKRDEGESVAVVITGGEPNLG